MAEQLFTEDEKFNVEILAARRDALRCASQVAEPPVVSTPIPPRRRPDKSWSRPHVYIQLADESQRPTGIALKQRLIKSGYFVEGIENCSGNPHVPAQIPELRFFASADTAEAERIAKELAPIFGVTGIYANLPEGMPYVSHARQYEIWLASTCQ
jgi:hypothetical protein